MRSPKKLPTEKKTIAGLSRKHGIDRSTLYDWKKAGIDIFNDAELKARLETKQTRVTCSPTQTTTAPDTGESYSEARRRRAIADANRAEILAKREAGSVVDLEETKRAFQFLAHEVKGRLMAMRGDLVSELEGQTPSAIYEVLDKRFRELLQALYDSGKKYSS